MTTGEQLKQEGMELVSTNNPTWTDLAIEAIRLYSSNGKEFASDGVRIACELPEAPNRNCWGAAFSATAKLGHIECVGYRKSVIKSAHSRVVAVWRKK